MSHAQDWHKLETNARLAVLPAAGHCATIDNPEEFNEALQGLLEGQG